MVAATSVHHHRSTTKSSHKPFKSRFSSKGAQRAKAKGKFETPSKVTKKAPGQMVQNKLARRNQARQRLLQKHAELMKNEKIFDGRKGASRIIAVVPLCADTDASQIVRYLNGCVDIEEDVPSAGMLNVRVERFKQKLLYLIPERKYWSMLDACKYADFVMFVLSATQEVDEIGESFLRGIEGQGVSSVMTVIQNLNSVEPAKRRPDVKKSLLSYITHFFPAEEKLFAVDSQQEALNLVRSLCTQHPKGIIWRDARSYLLAEELTFDDSTNSGVITGTVRGRGLKADRLVHIQGYGDFQIDRICSIEDDSRRSDASAMDTSGILESASEKQESLEQFPGEPQSTGTEPPPRRKGVLLDDHHYFDDDIIEEEDESGGQPVKKRRIPKGFSEQQARWIVDSDDDNSDLDDEEADMEVDGDAEEVPAGMDEDDMEQSEFGDGKSSIFNELPDEEELRQIEEFRRRNKEAKTDLEFPDEVELHPTDLAREKLHRYRGLKNFRTSPWETEEDYPHQPPYWEALARIENYKGTKSKVMKEALEGGVAPGTRVKVYLKDFPIEVLKRYDNSKRSEIFGLFSLLRHERKKAVVNCTISLSSEYEGPPIKAKDELILQCGARRWKVKPLFSQGGATKNNVHKFERWLQPGSVCVATFVGEIAFGSIPLLWYREKLDGSMELVGSGTYLNADHDRVIAKRKIITGHPYKIHKKLVTVRYMFFNSEDVNWFKALPLYTKRGRSGFIKESLGTHGYYKATFDGKINPQDAICINLYKRCFPLESEEFRAI